MGKDKNRAPNFKVPIPYIPEDEKEADPSDGKPPSVKLLLDAKREAIDNLRIQVPPIFNGGTTKQIFKWYKVLIYLLEGRLKRLSGSALVFVPPPFGSALLKAAMISLT
jgi:hypothetical protein